jgi:hypothetical protein
MVGATWAPARSAASVRALVAVDFNSRPFRPFVATDLPAGVLGAAASFVSETPNRRHG